MHTPDGLLTGWICLLCWIIAISATGIAVWRLRHTLTQKRLGLFIASLGLVFALQLLNVPIASGTSGHIIGAGLLALLFGPSAAIVGMAIVLSVQTALFGDGGTLSLGANIFSMGIVASLSTWGVHRSLRRAIPVLSSGISGMVGVLAAAASTSLLLASSGVVPLNEVLPSMLSAHLVVGLMEALILVVGLGVVRSWSASKVQLVRTIAIGSLLLVALILPFVSSAPDAMESVSIRMGFFERAVEIHHAIPFPGYALFGNGSYWASLAVAAIGISIVMVMGLGVTSFVVRKERA
ncbi:MAG: energy-coupling factor ABC transporter permease [archaeon]